MRLAGFLLMLAGWGIVIAAVTLLPGAAARSSFVVAGTAVELLGVGLVIRSYPITTTRKRS